MEKKLKIIKISTIIACIAIFTCAVILVIQFIRLGNLRHKEQSLSNYREALIRQIEDYNSTSAYYDNNRDEFLEDYAREVLGWGQADDTWYRKG